MLYIIVMGVTLILWGVFDFHPFVALPIAVAAYAGLRLLSQGSEKMIKVVQGGDIETLRGLLRKKWDKPALAFGLRTAAALGRTDQMNLLLDAGAPVNDQTGTRGLVVRTALMEAALQKQGEAVKVLLQRGANPNAQVDASGHRSSPLQFACMGGDPPCVGALLDAGADPRVPNAEAETPLMYAAACGHAEAVRLLVGKGVDVNATTKKGHSALDWARATMSGWGQREVLTRAGATINEAGLKETDAYLASSGAKAFKL